MTESNAGDEFMIREPEEPKSIVDVEPPVSRPSDQDGSNDDPDFVEPEVDEGLASEEVPAEEEEEEETDDELPA